ncbi:MAG: aldo/keto reductase [Microbacteriaceae bacterium]|nr:aldo/keto reductase [Microbacteriaceae bacterium]
MPNLRLNDGNQIPQLGFGVFKVADEIAEQVVTDALHTGYRHIDTAMIYKNEEAVGRAINSSAIPREELFITTKLWNTDQGADTAIPAFEASLERLGLDYVDLYLIHWPGNDSERYLRSWEKLEEIKESGRARSIGVSNFRIRDIENLAAAGLTVPAVNQIELHPAFQQHELRTFQEPRGIRTEAWGPLGQNKYDLRTLDGIEGIAEKHGKSIQQVIIRWHLQSGVILFPKSSTRERIEENFNVFDFELDADDLGTFAGFDRGQRVGSNPDDVDF